MAITPKRLVELATAALQLPVDNRRNFLATECAGNAQVQQHVERIIALCVAAPDAASLPQSIAEPTSLKTASWSTISLSARQPDEPASTIKLTRDQRNEAELLDRAGDSLGDHEILSQLGRGGMGLVYKARQRTLNRIVALKMILAGQLADDDDIERFHTEAQAAARLDHPGIVPVYEVGQHDGRPYFTMGFVDGPSLSQHLGARPIDPQLAAQLCEKIARAVQYAHEKGVVHRDLKPSNILLDRDLTPRVSDFGLAKLMSSDSGLTMTGQVMGTPSYMAPEQAAGRTIDARADIYSVGAILYACLTGRPPFEAATPVETLRQVQQNEPVAPWQLNPAVPRDLETICLKCLEKDPARRYAQASEVADELQRYTTGQPILARPIGRVERVVRWSRRNPREARLVGTLLAILLLTSIGSAIAAVLINSARSDAEVARTAAENSKRQAIASRDAARRNELQAKQLLSDSYVQTARLAAQRGQWQIALDNLNRALELGHRDEIGVRLARVEAYEAMNEVANSRSEIEWLAAQPELGSHRGAVLLWQGDLALPRGQQERAIELIQLAQAAGLSPADEAYAAALLAETTPTAIVSLETALQRDPFHHRGMRLLTFLLLLSGRHDEVRERVAAAELLFPDDANFTLLNVASVAAGGDLELARKRLAALRGELGDDYGTMEVIIQALAFAAQSATNWDGSSTLTTAKEMVGFITALQRAFLERQRGKVSPLAFALTPAITKAITPLRQAMITSFNPLVFNREAKVAQLLDESCRHHPEGTMYFLQAASSIGSENYAEAERMALLAAATPAVIPAIHREAYFVAAMSQVAQSALEGNKEKLPLAVENARKRFEFGDLRPLHTGYLSKIAESGGDWQLARETSDLLLSGEPNNVQYLADRARVENKAENWLSAIDFADKALSIASEHPDAQKTRDAALAALRKRVDELAAVVEQP